ncbi:MULTISPECIES: alpha-2-macroglobulin [unclassified Campylobacter]|uniref:alpha-2-macroglobulin family protein n=1 Tax=unclassified Campylobacter TaxID=2593542 RepID=UPI001474E722|nr:MULTISPECIES: alpha-2-macroglobulin [unclassified Campylobacter]
MLFRSTAATLMLCLSLNAFTLTGDFRAPDDRVLIFGVKYEKKATSSLIGTMTHKKLLTCTPELEGVYEYGNNDITLYLTKPLVKGIDYNCIKDKTSSGFYSGDFVLDKFVEYSKSDYLIGFNDEVKEEEFVKNFKIYERKNLAKNDIKYKITSKTKNNFNVKLLSSGENLIFDVSNNLKSTSGINLDNNYAIPQEPTTEEMFVDNPEAKTMLLTAPKAVSLDNGKLAIRLYLKNWLDYGNFHKFVSIDGVKNFKVSEIEYTNYTEKEDIPQDHYYYIDVTSDEFKPNTEYKIRYLKGFGDRYSLLRESAEFKIKFGNLKPFLKFSDPQNAPYMSNIGEIAIESVNTSTAKVVVEKLMDQNYRYFLNFSNEDLSPLVKEVASKNYELGGTLNEISKHKIKLDFADSGDGVYLITIYYDKEKSTSKVVYLTDIGVSVKLAKDEIFLFANRLSQNAVVANADVKIYSNKNEILANGITNDEGIFKFNKKNIGEEASSAVVTIGKEQGFIILTQGKNLNENGYYPKKAPNELYSAYLHFASDIIRPSDTIKGEIIIKNAIFSALSEMPVKLKIKDPQNKTILNKSIKTDKLGVINFDESVNSELSGSFKFEVIFADRILTSQNFSVESFTPQRIKNNITLNKDIYNKDELIEAKLQSNYLFGAPAGDLKGNIELNMYQKEYSNDKFKNYNFSNSEYSKIYFDQIFKDIKLDKDGKSTKIIKPLIGQKKVASVIGATLVFNINDDGKNISASKNLTIYPFDTMVGIKADTDFTEVNNNVNFNFINIDPISGEEKQGIEKVIDIKRGVWNYNLDKEGVMRWNKNYESISKVSQSTNTFSYSFSQSGDYKVVVTDTISGHSSSINIYVSGWDYGSLAPTKELAKAQIKLNQKSYKKGDVMSVDVSSVLKNAMALVTLESNGVKKHKILNIQNNSANVKFDLDFDFEGLYVSALIIRVADSDILPFRAYDKVYAKAEHKERNMEVKAKAPNVVRSNSKFKMEVKADPNSEITLFAVDEGILQITNQKFKSPLDFFNKAIADSVLDFDIFDSITGFKKDGKVLSFGGDTASSLMEMRMAKFATPVDKKNVKTYIKMQTTKADASGNATFEVEVPEDFNSKINLAVLAKSESKLGFDISEINVKDDIILKPTQTAYLVKGDKINYILRVINTTNDTKEITLSLDTNLNAKLEKEKITLKPNENLKTTIVLEANSTGKSFLKFKANDGKESYSYSLNLDVVYPCPLSTYATSFQASEKKTLTFEPEFKDIKIDASTSIKSLLGANSDKLINYPYGCSEQRSSKLLELNALVLNDQNSTKSRIDAADIKRFITAGMKDLIKMQKADGSFGYWGELSYTNNFASIYAIDTLLELEKSGFELDKNVKSKAISWLMNFGSKDNLQALYAAYVLSTQNKLEKSAANALYDNRKFSTSLEAYLMASILQNVGLKKESENALKQISDVVYNKEKSLADNFGSRKRNTAFTLLLHTRHFKKNAFSEEMANYLIKNIDKMYSTQERAFTLMALRAYIKDTSTRNKFKISYDGQDILFDGLNNIDISPKKPEITVTPESGSSVYLSVRSLAYRPLNINHDFNKKGLDIYRTFVDKNGKEVDINNIKLNDVIYSKLTLKTIDYIRNGVINEQISPCFEVINENIAPNLRTKATKNTLYVEHQNIQDDRVLSFYSLNSGYANEKDKVPFAIYTPLRVVMSGKCMLPAVITENMYDESISDYDLAQKEFIVK